MDEIEKGQKSFVGYEYKKVMVKSSVASSIIDGYKNFGWEIDENLLKNSNVGRFSNQSKVVICLKRNRKTINKIELTRLQRNFEACVREIETLEKSKTSVAVGYVLILMIMGTAFMAGSTFAVTAQPPHIIWCVLLAIPGFLGWISPYFLFKRIVRKQIEELTPLIEEKYDEIYEICERGNRLLN